MQGWARCDWALLVGWPVKSHSVFMQESCRFETICQGLTKGRGELTNPSSKANLSLLHSTSLAACLCITKLEFQPPPSSSTPELGVAGTHSREASGQRSKDRTATILDEDSPTANTEPLPVAVRAAFSFY